jgi:uncharacterized protein YbjQ (UPF0145 family)
MSERSKRKNNVLAPVPRPVNAALSELSAREFVTLARAGYVPRGLAIGVSVYDAGFASLMSSSTRELTALSQAMHGARAMAMRRLSDEALRLGAEGVVGVRVDVEHHRWRGGHTVARFVAVGTAIAVDYSHGPEAIVRAPSLGLRDGVMPFTSDLSATDFVSLLRAGYRPVALAFGNSARAISSQSLRAQRFNFGNVELAEHTRALYDARELAMLRLEQELFAQHPAGSHDAPVGVVGMTVSETMHEIEGWQGRGNIIECTAVGTAVAHLPAGDPRRAPDAAPAIVMPVDG